MKSVKVQDIRLFEFLIAIVVVLLLILFITRMNLSQKGVIDEVNFAMASQNFNQNAALIRAQWLIKNRPKELAFNFFVDRYTISNTRLFKLSNLGWPIVDPNNENMCHTLWFDINNLDKNENVSRYVSIKKVTKNNDNRCQFCDAGDNNSCIEYSGRYGVKRDNI
ncbi:hypothetical protein ACMAZF_01805 [Psychrobium sp. nBUS_13]|jgi:hypothetical protein|uniref:hypothetical protein n=1 Tax=Psychrobium sp. nBUS_13 TaxID=3395319 RepID=UPI003EBF0C03